MIRTINQENSKGLKDMEITMLTGSPHTDGTTAFLADRYIDGANNAGYVVKRFDTARLLINPCKACDYCRKNNGKCVFNDDMTEIYPYILNSDRLVLVTPLYYFGMSSTLKCAIDRFYAIDKLLLKESKELDLIAASGEKDDWMMEPLVAQYDALGKYYGWICMAPFLAKGFYTRKDIEKSIFGIAAKERGEK